MTHIVGILLAGGRSRRYGTKNKLTECGADGVAIGIKAARTLARVVDELLVVVAPEEQTSFELFSRVYPTTQCPDAHKGMGHTVAHGVGQTVNADGWVIGLADMPYVRSATIASVCDAIDAPDAIARPRYGDRAGHPVGFGKDYYNELIALTGDTGAQSIIARHQDAVTYLATDDAGVVMDIDRPQDLAKQGPAQA